MAIAVHNLFPHVWKTPGGRETAPRGELRRGRMGKPPHYSTGLFHRRRRGAAFDGLSPSPQSRASFVRRRPPLVYSAGRAPMDPPNLEEPRCPSEPSSQIPEGERRRTGSASGCGPGRGARSSGVGVPRAEPGSPRRPGSASSSYVRRLLAEGTSVHGARVVVFVAPGSGNVAFVAGRRVGGAVIRNRARRVLRAAWRELAPRVREGFDVALVARGTIRGAKTQDLVAEVDELLTRARVIRT